MNNQVLLLIRIAAKNFVFVTAGDLRLKYIFTYKQSLQKYF